MTEQPWVKTDAGQFRLTRQPTSQQFVCDRCLRPKVSKVIVEWHNAAGTVRSICNGCYGNLRAAP